MAKRLQKVIIIYATVDVLFCRLFRSFSRIRNLKNSKKNHCLGPLLPSSMTIYTSGSALLKDL